MAEHASSMPTIESILLTEPASLQIANTGYVFLGPAVHLSHMTPVFPDRPRQVLVISSHWSPPLNGAYHEICPNLVEVLRLNAFIPSLVTPS